MKRITCFNRRPQVRSLCVFLQTFTLGIAAQLATPLDGAPDELTASVTPASGCPAVDFARTVSIEVCAPGTFISIGDFNRDGKPDLAVGYQGAANFGCTNSG